MWQHPIFESKDSNNGAIFYDGEDFAGTGIDHVWLDQETPISRLPSFAELDAQLKRRTQLPGIRELATYGDPKDLRNLEDWERFSAARDITKVFPHAHRDYWSDVINPTVEDKRNFSIFASEKDDALGPPTPRLSNILPDVVLPPVLPKRLVVKLRYGRRNRRRVAALLKLPNKRKISDGVHELPQSRAEISHGVLSLSRPPYQESSYLNNGAEYITEPFSGYNNRIAPGETSNAVMMRFESNAKELEIASYAATDASHRSISDEEDLAISPYSSESSEEDIPTAISLDVYDSDDELNRSSGMRPSDPIKCFCDYGSRTDNMIMCGICRTWQHTECYYPGKGELGEVQMQTQHQQEQQHICVNCVNSGDNNDGRYFYLDYFKAATRRLRSTRPQSQLKNLITRDDLGEVCDTTIDTSSLRTRFIWPLHQDPTPWMESISNETPKMLTEVNSAVDNDIQSADRQRPFTAEAYTDSGYASNTTRALKPTEVLGQSNQTDIESRSLSSLDESLQSTGEQDEITSIYSDASTIPTLTKARYIEGLADDLAQAIQPYQLNDQILQQILELLPELLKAFALTFGHHESGTMHRDVMVFIHRYRRYVMKWHTALKPLSISLC
jgi:hypothetical protein